MDVAPLLVARDIGKRFTTPYPLSLFGGIDLQLFAGDSVAIGGRSGQGKSTLLHVLGALDFPSQGELYLLGEKVHRFNGAQLRLRAIGFVFQFFYLFEELSALQNVLMAARIARYSTGKGTCVRQRGELLLEQVGLKERMDHPVKLLSGGEKQRVSLARALCNDPPLLLADEPTGNLDGETAELIQDLLFTFASQPGRALLLVTHDPKLLHRCKRRYRLEEGELNTLS